MTQAAIDEQKLKRYGEYLLEEGISKRTRCRYLHDAGALADFLGPREVTPELLKEFKVSQLEKNKAVSVKSEIFGVNKYLKFIGSSYRLEHEELSVHGEEKTGVAPTVQEYRKIMNAVRGTADDRLYLIVATICRTGLKLSEMQYLTVDAVKAGRLTLPAGQRVYLPKSLCADWMQYCESNGIRSGQVLLTKRGNLPDRSNISRSIKRACEKTGIEPEKLSTKSLRNFYFYALRYTFESESEEKSIGLGLIDYGR